MFYTLEKHAARHKMKPHDPNYWVSLAYEAGSNFGYRIGRPLAWFFGGILISTILLVIVGMMGGSIAVGRGPEAIDDPTLAADNRER